MERVLSQDERIRRAEELYLRRKLQAENRTSATVNVESSKPNQLTKKLIKQSIICILIYVSFYTLKSIPNVVSQEVMYKISDILEYDINIQELYNQFNKHIEFREQKAEGDFVEETLSITDSTEVLDNLETGENKAKITIEEPEVKPVEEDSSLSQMDLDAEFIKSNYSMTKPLEGEITSRFGMRNPTVPTVPKYHTGIDIARIVGTVIISSMEGIVELVSTEGDLRKSYNNN